MFLNAYAPLCGKRLLLHQFSSTVFARKTHMHARHTTVVAQGYSLDSRGGTISSSYIVSDCVFTLLRPV